MRLSGATIGLLLAVLCGASALTPERSFGGPSWPTPEQCSAGWAEGVYITPCKEDERLCLNAERLGVPHCLPPSPEEKALQDRLKREAAERDRIAKDKAQKRQALIDDKVRQLGPGREAEAAKFVDMKLAADDARPKPKTAPNCRMVKRSWVASVYSSKSLEAAQAQVPALQSRTCTAGRTCGPVQCGWSGFGPKKAQVGSYICKMDVSGEDKVCDRVVTPPAKVSAQ